jgi:hypothetical protein
MSAAAELDPARQVRVSLVVPVQDEEGTICSLLSSVAAQQRLPDELILVDAGSLDGTREAAAQVQLPEGLLKWVGVGRVHPGIARNLGAAQACCEWIAFTDAGICLEPRWLQALIRVAEHSAADVVFGSYEPVCDSFLRQCAALAYVPACGESGIRGPSVTSMMLRKALFIRTGGFPPYRAAEDLAFLENLRSLKPVEAFASEAIVHWYTAPTLRRTYSRFSLYSFHNLLAGRGWQWHRGVLRLYGVLFIAVATCIVLGYALVALGVVPLFYLVRSAKAAWEKRTSLPFAPLRVSHLVGAALLLAVLDAATLAGAVRWMLADHPR